MNMDLKDNIHILAIQKILEEIGERVEGNLFCDIDPQNYVYTIFSDKIKNLQVLCKDKKKICEIGVNACHSLLIMLLVNPDAEYLLFDLNNHRYTEPCLKYIKSAFPNTMIRVIFGNSVETITKYVSENEKELHQYDMCHIDGGHTENIFSFDYNNIKELSQPDSPVIFDDYDMCDIRNFINNKIASKEIVEYTNTALVKTGYHFIFSYLVSTELPPST